MKKENLRVFYGWSKLGKVRKREAISVIFENEIQKEEKTQRTVSMAQETVYVRNQNDGERKDAHNSNRIYTVYNIFMDDKRVNGSLKKALQANFGADSNNVSESKRKEIMEKLRSGYLELHPDYREPIGYQQLEFQFE